MMKNIIVERIIYFVQTFVSQSSNFILYAIIANNIQLWSRIQYQSFSVHSMIVQDGGIRSRWGDQRSVIFSDWRIYVTVPWWGVRTSRSPRGLFGGLGLLGGL